MGRTISEPYNHNEKKKVVGSYIMKAKIGDETRKSSIKNLIVLPLVDEITKKRNNGNECKRQVEVECTH